MVKHLLKYAQKYWRESWAIAHRILTELFRRKRSLIAWMIFPATILILNGMITGGKQNNFTTQEAFEIAAPATLVGAALFFSCLGGGVATIVSEREQQTLKRLFLSPLSGVSYFLGTFLAHSVIGIGQTLVIFAIAFFAGAEFPDANWAIAPQSQP